MDKTDPSRPAAGAAEAVAAAAEPSMEDILASIREILAEEEATEGGGDREPGDDEKLDLSSPPVAAPEPPADDRAVRTAQDNIDALFDAPAPPAEPEEVPDTDLDAVPGAAVDPPPPPPPPPSQPFAGGFEAALPPATIPDVMDLTPAMRVWPGSPVLSSPQATASTDVLAQLAKAILDRRDMAVSGPSATLEGMVREMLRPLLKEWLDRNLPYLIERLVKREIDQMINRAERLED